MRIERDKVHSLKYFFLPLTVTSFSTQLKQPKY